MPRSQPGKQRFTADLTDEAYARLQAFTAEQGAGDMVAFLEALCLHLDDRPPRRWLADVVIPEARRVHAERRRRSKP